MSGRRQHRVSKGVTNAGNAANSQRPGTASSQLSARLSNRGEDLLGSASAPALGIASSPSNQQRVKGSSNQMDGHVLGVNEDNPLPRLDGWGGGVPPRPSTTPGGFGRASSSAASPASGGRRTGRIFTPPRSSPGLSRGDARLADSNRATAGSTTPLYPSNGARSPGKQTVAGGKTKRETEVGGTARDSSGGYHTHMLDDGSDGIPLGLHKLERDDLEVYVNVVRETLARKAKEKKASKRGCELLVQAPRSTVSEISFETGSVQTQSGSNILGSDGGSSGEGHANSSKKEYRRFHGAGNNTKKGVEGKFSSSRPPSVDHTRGERHRVDKGRNRRLKHRPRSHHHYHHYHHHHHHHSQQGRGANSIFPSASVPSLSSKSWGNESNGAGSDSMDGGMSWFARSKGSKILPLRTIMLDPKVNNIPLVNTQSDFQALIKAQNIPHPSYDIDGDGVVSQEDYQLAKRFDINGDGVLDEAEQVIGRRIMAEMFLENHQHDLPLYGQGLAHKSMAANVQDISRSRGFKKIMNGLLEKEKQFQNRGSDGVKGCITLKVKSLTQHNFFSNKFDTTAWNDFTRNPRDADWLESRQHEGSRNQMYFMRKVEARESAQGKLNTSYKGDDAFSTRRITLITDPSVENS